MGVVEQSPERGSEQTKGGDGKERKNLQLRNLFKLAKHASGKDDEIYHCTSDTQSKSTLVNDVGVINLGSRFILL